MFYIDHTSKDSKISSKTMAIPPRSSEYARFLNSSAFCRYTQEMIGRKMYK